MLRYLDILDGGISGCDLLTVIVVGMQRKMVIIVHIKSTFSNSVKSGSTIRQVQYFTIHILH